MDLNQAQYAEKITLEEYNIQKNEYTQNALKELQKQMKQTTHQPKSKMFKFNDDDDENSVIEYSDEDISEDVDSEGDIAKGIDKNGNAREKQTNVNLIIKHVSTKEKSSIRKNNKKTKEDSQSHKRTSSNTTLTDAIYAQHEIDIKTIQSLKNLIKKLNNDIENESGKNHYLKLDLNNAQCDNNDLKKQNIFLQTENQKYKTQIIEYTNEIKQNYIYMTIMKFIIIVLLLVGIIY